MSPYKKAGGQALGKTETEAETGGTQPQGKERLEPPEAGRGQEKFSAGALGAATALWIP